MVYSGVSRTKALFLNVVSGLTAVGVLISHYFSMQRKNFVGSLPALAAGGFIYIAASELIPEIQKEKNRGRSVIQVILFISGIDFIWSLGLLVPA